MASAQKPGARELKQLGHRVAELRIARGLTQEAFAEILGKDLRYVQAIEGGRQNITIRTAVLVARALNSPLAQLFARPTTRVRAGLRRVPSRTPRVR